MVSLILNAHPYKILTVLKTLYLFLRDFGLMLIKLPMLTTVCCGFCVRIKWGWYWIFGACTFWSVRVVASTRASLMIWRLDFKRIWKVRAPNIRGLIRRLRYLLRSLLLTVLKQALLKRSLKNYPNPKNWPFLIRFALNQSWLQSYNKFTYSRNTKLIKYAPLACLHE